MAFPPGSQVAIEGTGQVFIVGSEIGKGGFGTVHKGTNESTGEDVAIKFEQKVKRQLYIEDKFYQIIQGGVGIPFIKCHGPVDDNYNAIVVDLLGPSLQDLFNRCNKKFSLQTILLLADQLLRRIEFIHRRGFIHRDVKPGNFLMGLGGVKASLVYVSDFGLVNKYDNRRQTPHVDLRFAGTPRFASINAHQGIEQSRRDDLEAIGYVLLYFLRGGDLPWKAKTKTQEIIDLKTAVQDYCRGYPDEFALYLNYCRRLCFNQDPDYKHLRELFRQLARQLGISSDTSLTEHSIATDIEHSSSP